MFLETLPEPLLARLFVVCIMCSLSWWLTHLEQGPKVCEQETAMNRVKVLPQSELQEGVRREVGVAGRVDKPE